MTNSIMQQLVITGSGNEENITACLAIAWQLDEYFVESAITRMGQDIASQVLYVATHMNEVVGFTVMDLKNNNVAEISWIAVKPEFQRQGIGTALVDRVACDFSSKGIEVIEVKTLSPDADYLPYEKTRRFYEKAGFIHLDTIDPYPGWEPGNPCAIYIKVLSR
ncbi:MAG: GNAT family N-acetyltransferase [Dehalococcoidales bacterium]|nr:MAG: GNAT family N-acetyltransferase [Dehalococcoidales bacterium]